jgi:hypothetical protein
MIRALCSRACLDLKRRRSDRSRSSSLMAQSFAARITSSSARNSGLMPVAVRAVRCHHTAEPSLSASFQAALHTVHT